MVRMSIIFFLTLTISTRSNADERSGKICVEEPANDVELPQVLRLPVGTTMVLPGTGAIILRESYWMSDRRATERYIEAMESVVSMRTALADAEAARLEAEERVGNHPLLTALKWSATVLAVGAAFGGGLYIGARIH